MTLPESLLILSLCLRLCWSSPPNVLIFLVDDLGPGDLGFTGHPTISSPNIDRLARDGLVLTEFYAASPVCTPSRASLLTGQFSVLAGDHSSLLTPHSGSGRLAVRSGMYPGVLMTNSLLGLPLEEVTLGLSKERSIKHKAS